MVQDVRGEWKGRGYQTSLSGSLNVRGKSSYIANGHTTYHCCLQGDIEGGHLKVLEGSSSCQLSLGTCGAHMGYPGAFLNRYGGREWKVEDESET